MAAHKKAAAKKNEVIKGVATGRPDMRLSENREKYSKDPLLTMNGRPDMRKLENRPDLAGRKHGAIFTNLALDE